MKRDDRLTYEFMPASLEIIETPASPLGKTVIWAIVALLAVALIWAYFGRIDEVATARGQMIPDGKAKVIQSATGGIVSEIKVKNGQKVKKGDTLIQLDTKMSQADVDRYEKMVASLRLEKSLSTKIASGQDVTSELATAQLPDENKQNLQSYLTARQATLQARSEMMSLSVAKQQTSLDSLRTALQQKNDEVARAQGDVARAEAIASAELLR